MNIMIDLETLATTPDAVILTIGAVAFDIDGITDRFSVNVDVDSQPDRKMSRSTLMWWLGQSEEARKSLTDQRCTTFRESLIMLKDFILIRDDCDTDYIKVWGNGSDFDNAILNHAYKGKTPWKFWNNRCYRTIKSTYPHIKADEREGVYHNAVDDAEFQALHLIKIAKEVANANII